MAIDPKIKKTKTALSKRTNRKKSNENNENFIITSVIFEKKIVVYNICIDSVYGTRK